MLYLYNILAIYMYFIEKTPSDSLNRLKERFKSIRKNQKISQEELAHRSGVSFGSVKRFETTGKISLDSFLKLMHVLGKLEEIDKLLNPEEDLSQIDKLFGKKSRK